MDTKGVIKQFILSEIINHSGRKDLEDTEPLLESGIIDSLGMMKLLLFLEEKFSINTASEDLMPETFGTVEAISLWVESRRD
jgi:acyl carrier protein